MESKREEKDENEMDFLGFVLSPLLIFFSGNKSESDSSKIRFFFFFFFFFLVLFNFCFYFQEETKKK